MSTTAIGTIYDTIEEVGKDLYIKALTDIPQDVRKALKRGYDAENTAGGKTGTKVMLTILENIKTADDQDMMVCQDTGLPIYKVLVGQNCKLELDMVEVKKRLRIGCERATQGISAAPNTVHPLTRKNTQTNTGQGMPIIKIDFVPDSDKIEIWMAPKGSGSENMSFLRMLKPADGIKAVKRFVLECIFESGAQSLPAGDCRHWSWRHERLRCRDGQGGELLPQSRHAERRRAGGALEAELLDLINQTGIGPQGLGGVTTAMAVNIEWAHTHISQNPRGGEHAMLARRAGERDYRWRWKRDYTEIKSKDERR